VVSGRIAGTLRVETESGFMEGIKDIMSIPKTRFFIEDPNRLRDNAMELRLGKEGNHAIQL
jgi:hypothetical protein